MVTFSNTLHHFSFSAKDRAASYACEGKDEQKFAEDIHGCENGFLKGQNELQSMVPRNVTSFFICTSPTYIVSRFSEISIWQD